MAQANSQNAQKKTIIDKFIEFSLNYIPDSMVFVLGLTVFVFVLALIFTDSTPWGLVEDYAKGFWELLSFSMQMCLMMISGFVIANAKPVRRGIVRLIDWPKTRGGTIALFALITGVISWLHWGVGLMATIIMGKEIAIRKRGQGFHYAFIVAMAYTSMNIMANGISQAAPLLSATPGNFMEKIMGGIVPISQTSLSPYMMTFLVLELLALPVVYYLLMPKKEKAVEISDELYKEFTAEPEKVDASKKLTPAERWERSRVLNTLIALLILIWFGDHVITEGVSKINLNTINFALFGLGLLFHDSPHSYIESVKEGATTVYGVIIQFPLYAGIFGLITFSGLADEITELFISIATPGTYPWIVFIYTGIMDFFVPSAGSKFVIEAPYLVPAAQHLGVPVSQVINAYGTGAQMANLIQPFWAIAYLAAFRLRFQEILPFTFMLWLFVFIAGSLWFLIFPFGW